MTLRRLACAAPLVLLAACGDNQLGPPPPPPPLGDAAVKPADGGGSGVDGSADGGLDGGVAIIDMSGFNLPGSPMVVIDAPAAGAEVHGDTLDVKATVTPSAGTLIAGGSVQLAITPPGGGIVTAPMILTATPNQYEATLGIAAVPSGAATFTVTAADLTGKQGSASGSYVHDHGPTITFYQPMAASARGTVSVEFTADDPLHPITSVSQVQAGIRTANDITLTQVPGAVPFRVAATVDIANNPKYNPPLDGIQIITATATNSAGTVAKAQRQFTVDNQGPDINITNPPAGSFVGGVVEITADITDESKVNDATAVAVFGGNVASVPLTRLKGDTFHGYFDVRSLGTSYVLPELSVRADDLLGNHAEQGQEIIVDNTRPFMTMDPSLQVRVAQQDKDGVWECTRLFPPLGPEAMPPGYPVLQQMMTLRARIEDHGNSAPGLLTERLSGIDADSVELFVMPDDGEALAVDTDSDGLCDDVNPKLIPTTQLTGSGQVLAFQMVPMAFGGAGDYRFDAAHTPTTLGGTCTAGTTDCPPAGCGYVGDPGATLPGVLCPNVGTLMTYVLPYVDVVSPIWTLPPVNATECVGFQVDALNSNLEGPACAVARATDKAGNTNVSYPLHICIDRGGGLCSGFVADPTHCTGVYDKLTQTVPNGSTCAEPPDHDVGGTRQGTFPKLGEVRYLLK